MPSGLVGADGIVGIGDSIIRKGSGPTVSEDGNRVSVALYVGDGVVVEVEARPAAGRIQAAQVDVLNRDVVYGQVVPDPGIVIIDNAVARIQVGSVLHDPAGEGRVIAIQGQIMDGHIVWPAPG